MRRFRWPEDPVAGARPLGLGIAVVFDWALTAQLLTQAVAGELRLLRLEPGPAPFAGRIAGALAMFVLGEALRRRAEWARRAQIVLCAGVTLGGIALGVSLMAGHSGRSAIVSAAVMVTFAPWVAVRLASRATRAWFAGGGRRDPATAGRTGGVWLWLVALQAALWGSVVALSQSL